MNQRRIPDENDNVPSDYRSNNQFLSYQKAIGLLLRRLRRMNNCSQSHLAQRAGTDSSYVSDVERGTSNISVKKLWLFGGALNIGEDKLLHMSNQFMYSAQLNEARSAFNAEYISCGNRMRQKDKQMIKESETEPVPENQKATPYS